MLRGLRVLLQLDPQKFDTPKYPNIWIEPVEISQLICTLFVPFMRDGGDVYDVQNTIVQCVENLMTANAELFAQPLKPHGQKARSIS